VGREIAVGEVSKGYAKVSSARRWPKNSLNMFYSALGRISNVKDLADSVKKSRDWVSRFISR
jgi:hypothetical protein